MSGQEARISVCARSASALSGAVQVLGTGADVSPKSVRPPSAAVLARDEAWPRRERGLGPDPSPSPSLPHPPIPPLPPCSLLENTKLRLGLSSFPYGERCKPVQCMAGHFVHNFAASGSRTRWGNHQFSSSHLVCTRSEQQCSAWSCLPRQPCCFLGSGSALAKPPGPRWGTDVGVLPLNPGFVVPSVPPRFYPSPG